MEEDPYNNLGNLRARTANEILKAFRHVASHEASLHLPIYAHHGTHDRLANLEVMLHPNDTQKSYVQPYAGLSMSCPHVE